MMEKLDAGIWTQAGGKVNGQQDNWVHYEPEGWVETYFKLFIFIGPESDHWLCLSLTP